jgi:hypothetical protein
LCGATGRASQRLASAIRFLVLRGLSFKFRCQPRLGAVAFCFLNLAPNALVSCQARFCQIEITLNTPQRVIIDDALVS